MMIYRKQKGYNENEYVLENCGEVCEAGFEADYSYICPALKTSLEQEAQVEESEADTIYPEFARVADEEGFEDIATLFENIRKVEIKHKKIFLFLYEGYKNGTLYKSDTSRRYVCPSCGHEMQGKEPMGTCPLCKAKMQTFTILLPKELAF